MQPIQHVDDHRINMTVLDVLQQPQVLGATFLRRPGRDVVIDVPLGDRPSPPFRQGLAVLELASDAEREAFPIVGDPWRLAAARTIPGD